MVVETVPKDILDKLNAGIEISNVNFDIRDLTSVSDSVEVKQATATNLKAEIVNPAGAGLTTLSYGSSDGGTNWYPLKVDASGVAEVKQASTKTHNVYTFNEYLMDNGTRVMAVAAAQNSTVTIYTVPAGKVFYLSSATVSGKTEADVSSSAEIKAAGTIIGTVQLNGDNATGEVGIPFAIPLKLIAGELMEIVTSNASLYGVGAVTGYTLDA